MLWQDLRYALRWMRKSPAFTTVAILSLALGIGANTAIFSLIDALILRTLPVRDPGQLVEFLNKYPGEPGGNSFSWKSYENFRDRNHSFSGLIADSGQARLDLRGNGSAPEIAQADYVTGDFFSNLGLQAALGRMIAPQDSSAVAVISWSWWQRQFNRDSAILGKRITVGDAPVTIIGVAQGEFVGLQSGSDTDLWLPVPGARIGHMGLRLMARLRPGVSLSQAQAEMNVLYRSTVDELAMNSKDPLLRQMKIEVRPAANGLSTRLRDQFAKPLLMTMALVGLLLLIACTNVAGMLLARGASRRREIAVRVSLGAGRLRLMRQVLTESLLLSAAGTVPGILLAYSLTKVLVRIVASGRQRIEIQVQPDLHVLLFTAGAALLTGALFGLAPAFAAFASSPISSMRETGRGGETRVGRLLGKSLVIAQVALSVVLLSAAGLFVGHLSNLEHLDLGFQRDHVLLVTLDPARSGYTPAQLAGPYRQLLGRLQAIPGVRSATLSAVTPISGAAGATFASVEGHPETPAQRRYVSFNSVAPGYFETFGTPLLAGRDFSFEDQGRPRVAIINPAMARYYFGDGNPIGKHVTLLSPQGNANGDPYEIVGVAGDARYTEILEDTPRTFYSNAFQGGRPYSQFALRTSVDPAAVAGEVRRVAGEVLKTVPVVKVTTLADQVDASIVPERLIATLSGLFGALGAALAAIGIYGLLAYTVARRIGEIGVRMALGATEGAVTRMVLGDALWMVCAGLVAGVPMALWGKAFAATLIRDLPAESLVPVVFGAAAMIAVALVAAFLPARRAARVNPIEALRCD